MLSVGRKVVYKHGGVYEIEDIMTPTFAPDSSVLYYKLSHIFSTAKETVYVPCDSGKLLRSVITSDAFTKCVKKVRSCPIVSFTAKQPQMISEHYKKILSDNSFSSLLSVYRELLLRDKECTESNKKLRQAEAHYLALTEKAICEELCVCFGLQPDETKEKLIGCLL